MLANYPLVNRGIALGRNVEKFDMKGTLTQGVEYLSFAYESVAGNIVTLENKPSVQNATDVLKTYRTLTPNNWSVGNFNTGFPLNGFIGSDSVPTNFKCKVSDIVAGLQILQAEISDPISPKAKAILNSQLRVEEILSYMAAKLANYRIAEKTADSLGMQLYQKYEIHKYKQIISKTVDFLLRNTNQNGQTFSLNEIFTNIENNKRKKALVFAGGTSVLLTSACGALNQVELDGGACASISPAVVEIPTDQELYYKGRTISELDKLSVREHLLRNSKIIQPYTVGGNACVDEMVRKARQKGKKVVCSMGARTTNIIKASKSIEETSVYLDYVLPEDVDSFTLAPAATAQYLAKLNFDLSNLGVFLYIEKNIGDAKAGTCDEVSAVQPYTMKSYLPELLEAHHALNKLNSNAKIEFFIAPQFINPSLLFQLINEVKKKELDPKKIEYWERLLRQFGTKANTPNNELLAERFNKAGERLPPYWSSRFGLDPQYMRDNSKEVLNILLHHEMMDRLGLVPTIKMYTSQELLNDGFDSSFLVPDGSAFEGAKWVGIKYTLKKEEDDDQDSPEIDIVPIAVSAALFLGSAYFVVRSLQGRGRLVPQPM